MTATVIIAVIAIALLYFYLMHHKDEALASDNEFHTPIIVTGHWIDTGEEFKHYCIIGDENTCPERHSGKVFWYFRDAYEVIGYHDEFHINGFTYINKENSNG